MNIQNIWDTWPAADVVQGTISLPDGTVLQTLQHDPCPPGVYTLEPHTIKEGALIGLRTYALVNHDLGVVHEPGDAEGYTGPYPVRVAILFHPGNWPSNSLGCILPGLSRDTLQPPPSFWQSAQAFKKLMQLLGTGVSGHTWSIQSSG